MQIYICVNQIYEYNHPRAMTTSRQRILAYLRKSRAASAREIARAMNMTPANVRRHLSILQKDGRVASSAVRREGRGRPVRFYSLSTALTGDNIPGMLDAALSTWLDVLQPDERNEALRALGQRLGRDAPAKGASFARRLASVAEQLSRLHYDAHWEAGAEGPRMILGRCPYAAIIERHPELCQADAAMLGALLESGVEQRSKLQPVCIFLVTP